MWVLPDGNRTHPFDFVRVCVRALAFFLFRCRILCLFVHSKAQSFHGAGRRCRVVGGVYLTTCEPVIKIIFSLSLFPIHPDLDNRTDAQPDGPPPDNSKRKITLKNYLKLFPSVPSLTECFFLFFLLWCRFSVMRMVTFLNSLWFDLFQLW